jgi:ABC-2 type transport system permease protein
MLPVALLSMPASLADVGAPAWLGWVSPLAGFAFLWLASGAWRLGVRHYASTGS